MFNIMLDGKLHTFFRYSTDIPNSLIFQCSGFNITPMHWFWELNPNVKFKLYNEDSNKLYIVDNGMYEINLKVLSSWKVDIIYPQCKCCKHQRTEHLGTMIKLSDVECLFIFNEANDPIKWLDIIGEQKVSSLISSHNKYSARDLARKLLEYPDFDVRFSFSQTDDSDYGMTVHSFNKIDIHDIGHSNNIILLGGESEK